MGVVTLRAADRIGRLCRWALAHALRRRAALVAVLGAMLLKIGLSVLAPWPMKVLVDHALGDRPLPPPLAAATAWLPGGGAPGGLVGWCVAATVVLFLAGWSVGLVGVRANIAFAQRMVYDLASDLFAHLQRLSLRFHARRPVGDTIRRVTEDCRCVATIVRDALLPVLTSATSLVV